MRDFSIFAATLFVSLLSGCATKKDLVPTGGSRADGTVNLSYEYGGIEQPQIDIAQGTAAATSRCQSWGYSGAEAFGGVVRTCQASNQYGCIRWNATMTFQCLGRP